MKIAHNDLSPPECCAQTLDAFRTAKQIIIPKG